VAIYFGAEHLSEGGDMAQQEWKVLSEKTLIPISAIGLVIGAAMWITAVYAQGEENAKAILEIKSQREKDSDRIYHELELVNDKLDRLIERTK
jgi:hypothetical protein